MNLYLNVKIFWVWIVTGIVHGILVFWIPALIFYETSSEDGLDDGLWFIGTVAFTLLIFVSYGKLFLDVYYWNVLGVVLTICSTIMYFLWYAMVSYTPDL